jgi:hypothetical protein
LGSDNAGGFAEFDERASGEISAIASFADTVFAFASEHGADFDFFNAGAIDLAGFDLVNFLVRTNDVFLGILRIRNVVA